MKASAILYPFFPALFLVATALPGAAGQVTVTNASFETPPAPVVFSAPLAGDVPGWHLFFSTDNASASISIATNTNSGVAGTQVLAMSVDASLASIGFANAHAQSSGSLLTVAPATTYTLTVAASSSGPAAGATVTLLAGAMGVSTSIPVHTGPALSDYSASFTTAATGDSRVGQPLTILLTLQCQAMGFGSAVFDNVRLTAGPPQLTIKPLANSQAQLAWPMSFSTNVLYSTTNILKSSWTTVTNPIATQGDQYTVTVTPGPQQTFYRVQ